LLDLAENKHHESAKKGGSPFYQDKNEAITAKSKNKEHIEKTNVDIKYTYKSPYVNDKETLNGALKFDSSNEGRIKQGSPA